MIDCFRRIRPLMAFALLLPLQSAQAQGFEDQLFGLVNAERQAAGVDTLGLDLRLQTAAHAHAIDMATHGCNSHDACDGTPWSAVVGPYPGGTTLNLVGTGFPTPPTIGRSCSTRSSWAAAPAFTNSAGRWRWAPSRPCPSRRPGP